MILVVQEMAFEKNMFGISDRQRERERKKRQIKVQFQQDSFVSLSFPQAICASTNSDARRINKPNAIRECCRIAGGMDQITKPN